jgi:hypothetical protein
MNYDRVFNNDLDRKFFYSDYPGRKLMVGSISLSNAIARLNNIEYYVLVTYKREENLPEQYIPLNSLISDDGTLFATLNPSIRYINYICQDGGIQTVSRLTDLDSGSPNYLLGPGPETVSLEDLIMKEYHDYIKSQTVSTEKGR